jgi:radical SAM enzyme (TIGR01210 family)
MNINTKLIQKYFLLYDGHNVLYNIADEDDLYIDKSLINDIFLHLKEVIKKNKSYQGLYFIETKNHLLLYFIEYLYHSLKIYRNKFKTQNDFELFIFISLSLQLTLFTQKALQIIFLAENILEMNEDLKLKTFSFVESNDPRGLLFYFCKLNDLPFDIIIEKKLIEYEYIEPSINKKWQKKYKEEFTPILFWFYKSLLGKGLFLVLYTPKCRYKTEHGGCSGCNLPTVSASSNLLNDLDVKAQIDSTLEHNLSNNERSSIKEIILSNNGSILDLKTISKEALEYVIDSTMRRLPNLQKIILETRIDDYTDFEQLKNISNKIKKYSKNISLELAIGFEIFDDNLRNGYYKKGLEKSILEEKVKSLSTIDISLKIYMMYKAVPDKYMSIDQSIDDINNASLYFTNLAQKNGIKINLHISPTYLATGTQLYKDFTNGLYTPLVTKDIEKLFNNLKIYDELSYYISMNDEGLTDNELIDESEYNEYLELKEKIYKFNIDNITQLSHKKVTI